MGNKKCPFWYYPWNMFKRLLILSTFFPNYRFIHPAASQEASPRWKTHDLYWTWPLPFPNLLFLAFFGVFYGPLPDAHVNTYKLSASTIDFAFNSSLNLATTCYLLYQYHLLLGSLVQTTIIFFHDPCNSRPALSPLLPSWTLFSTKHSVV